jgi:hypothetical protein
MASCEAASSGVLCLAMAVYWQLPWPCGSNVSTAVKNHGAALDLRGRKPGPSAEVHTSLRWGTTSRMGKEDAAGLQVDLACNGAVRLGAEPGHQVLRRGPGFEQQLRGHVHDALQHQVTFISQAHCRSPVW